MQLGTSHSGHPSPRRGSAPALSAARVLLPCPGASVTSVSCLCGLCVSALSLNSQLSTLNSEPLAANSAQSSCFHNLPHSSTTSQNSPLCFHNLTNSFSRSSFSLIFIQTPRGCHPPRSTAMLVAFVSTACAKHLKRIHLRRAVLTAQRRFSTVSCPMEKRCEFFS